MKRSAFVKLAAALGVALGLTAPASAQLALTGLGIQAPTAGTSVGTNDLKKGSIQYTNSTGSADNFSVGTSTSISAQSSASSTQDYSVNSAANFALDTSTIRQVIGSSAATSASSSMSIEQAAATSASTSVEQNYKTSHNGQSGWWWWGNNQWNNTTETEYNDKRQASYESAYQQAFADESAKMSGTISGTFTKDSGQLTTTTGEDKTDPNNIIRTVTITQITPESNDVVVRGIGADNSIAASSSASFSSDITKSTTPVVASQVVDANNTTTITYAGAGTASGSAAGAVNTTASASASSSQFVNSFVQAY